MRLTQSERDELPIGELFERDGREASALSRLVRPAFGIRHSLMSFCGTSDYYALEARAVDIEAAGLGDRLLGMELRPSDTLNDGEIVRVVLR